MQRTVALEFNKGLGLMQTREARSSQEFDQASAEQDQTAADQEQTAAELDQMAADQEQTAADQDETAADSDAAASRIEQRASDREQLASDREQLASDREQLASDREQLASDRAPAERSEETTQSSEAKAGRVEATDERVEATGERVKATDERRLGTDQRAAAADARADTAARRDATGRLRDLNAEARDKAAEARDRAATIRDEQFENGSGSASAALEYLRELREQAAADRLKTAADRWRAAEDRKQAALDLRRAKDEIEHAHLDDLTGVYRRDSGITAIQREINRAQRSDAPLALAFVDVDRLKDVNDREGHAAGDALLQEVVAAMRLGLRSYDPIVRLGGDEFACVLAGATLDEASRRMDQIREDVRGRGGSVSVGLSELNGHDTLETLMARGDAELYKRKGRSRRDGGTQPGGRPRQVAAP